VSCIGIKPTRSTPVPAQIPLARRDPREEHVCVSSLFKVEALIRIDDVVGMSFKLRPTMFDGAYYYSGASREFWVFSV